MRIRDWSSDVCSSDLFLFAGGPATASCLVIGRDGAVNVCEFRTSAAQIPDALHILRDGRWRRAPGTKNADQVAVSPFDPQHLVWANENRIGRASCRESVCQYV